MSDMAFVAPVFSGGKIVAFTGSIAHKADVGGTNPGSTSANATEIFQEGLLLPPMKIWEAGKLLTDVERLILANTRQPELVRLVHDHRVRVRHVEPGFHDRRR